MATPKYRGIKLGPQAVSSVSKNFESEVFVETSVPLNGTAGSLAWDIGTSYSLNDAVVYEGRSYNSLIGSNLGNQPDISPSEWVPVDGKDGDLWIQVPAAGFPAGGADVELWLKVAGIWRPTTWSNPITISLVDGQLTPEVALEYPAGVLPYAVVQYTIKRGAGNGRRRRGILIILNDGSSINHSEEFEEIGFDVQVPLDTAIGGGLAQVTYTSANEGTAIEMRYILRGWA